MIFTKQFLLILILFSAVFAQQFDPNTLPKIGVFKCEVSDSLTGQLLQYASVSMISQRNNEVVTGGIADELGKVVIENIPFGRYNVIIEYIGYEKVERGPITFNPRENVTSIDLGNIKLQQSALSYQSIEVEGERPLFTQTMDKKIFNVEQNTLTSGGTAIDVLRQVPGVDVDTDGNVSLRGSSNVNFLIDGKPALMAGGDASTLLDNIPADNISDVEVVTNPSAKYDPEGMAGIINVVLKENRFAGISGNVKSGFNSLGSYNGSGQLNLRNEKVNVFANVGYRNDVREMGGSNYRETYKDDFTNILEQEIDGERGGSNLFFKVGTEYFQNLKNTFGLNFTFTDGDRTHDQVVFTQETDEQYLEYESINDGIRNFKKYDVAASFDRKFDNPKQTLMANVHQSNSDNFNEDAKYAEANVGYEDLLDITPVRTQTDDKFSTLDTQVDYVHPFGEDTKLEVGYKGTIRSIDNLYDSFETVEVSGDEVLNEEESNHFLYSENIQAGYGVFSLQKEIWGLQLGLRSEIVETNSELKDTDEKLDNSYTSLFPSFAISFGPQQIFQTQLSYSKRIHRPSFRRLNPAIHSLDQYNRRMGNPFLKPEYIDVVELNFSKFARGLSISLGGYYRHVTDKVGYYRTVDEDGVGTTTYKNMNSQETYGVELIVSGSLSKKFRIMLNGNLFADEVNASDVFEDYDKTATGFFGRMTGTWKINPTAEVMLMGFYRSPRDMPIGSMKSMAFTSLSAKKKLMDNKLAISLKINDLFNTMGFGYKTYGENYYQDATRKWGSQAIGLQIEYKFGSIEDRSSFNKNRNGNNSNDSMGDYELD